jgi:hypothetical protein
VKAASLILYEKIMAIVPEDDIAADTMKNMELPLIVSTHHIPYFHLFQHMHLPRSFVSSQETC